MVGNISKSKGFKGDKGDPFKFDDLTTEQKEELRGELLPLTDASTIVNTAEGSLINITDSANAKLKGLKIYGKTTQNGVPTPSTPIKLVSVGDSGNLSVVCGNNILPYPYVTPSSVRYAENGDGSITVDIKHEDGLIYFTLYEGSPLSTEVAKIALLGQHHNMVIYCKILDNEGNELYFENSPTSLTIDFGQFSDDVIVKIGIRNNIKPYTAYGTVYPVYMSDFSECSVAIPPLRRIIGTNIRDEIDATRKVRIQRVNTFEVSSCQFSGNISDILGNYRCAYTDFPLNFLKGNKIVMSDRYSPKATYLADYTVLIDTNYNKLGIVDNRFTSTKVANEILSREKPEVLYALEEPIETPLTDEELQAYKALYTYYPKTFIYNSENTDIEVEYVADTKNYIDNKFAELQANILSIAK